MCVNCTCYGTCCAFLTLVIYSNTWLQNKDLCSSTSPIRLPAFCLLCPNFYCEHYGPTSLAASVIVHRLCLLVFCYWKCSLHRQKPDLRPHEQQHNTSATPPSHCRERHNAWKYCGKCQLAISHCFGTEIGHAALEGALYCFITAKSPLKDVNFTREVNCI